MYSHTQSRHRRASSPPLSVAGSSQLTTTQQAKLNVVTRLALEGKVKQGNDGATIRVYLKLSVPMDMVSPGSTVPLFPEENLKLLSAVLHPIDTNSVPYNFSSTAFPMLDNAVRALHLPAHSPKSYLSVFGVPTPASSTVHSGRTSSSSTASPTPSVPPLDERYTGHIIVSGYNISYILPKDFPPRFNGGDDSLRVSTFSATQLRRGSIGERNNMHFMAAIELWIPYTSRPPRAPFLLSIPVPRCLSNSIKLRIYPPNTASISSSMASLSSADEDPGAWELASEPHVTRTTSRSGSYADMADDESSDSSSYTDGPSGRILVHGTFPSTERLRIRWAQPTKTVANNLDGRRRVGVKEVKGDMTTVVLGKTRDPPSGREGILMRVEYKGACKGVWFPGVATMLGMDVRLEVGDADAVWPPDSDPMWTVSGGTGYTGFDVGSPPTPVSRQPSLDFPVGMSTNSMLYPPSMFNRHDSSASTSSLLRAPLPSDHIPDYSFEASPTSLTPSGTLSSVSSLPLTSEGRSRASSDATSTRPPAVPITIHVNMNDLVPTSKSTFTFSIKGTILVLPRPRSHPTNGHALDGEADAIMPIALPQFTVVAADSETTATIIKNESDGATVQVYNSSGDLHDAQTVKTVLQRQGMTRCGNDGGRISLRPISRSTIPSRSVTEQVADTSRLSPRLSPSSGNKVALSPLSLPPIQGGLTRRRRDGPLMIPSVHVVVTPLLLKGDKYPNAHAVRVLVQAPPEADSDWLEFGLASASSPSEGEGRSHQVDLVNVSVDGVPVRFESSAFAKQAKNPMIDLGPSYDEKPRNDWITWVKIHVGDQGGMVTVDYVINKINDQKPTKDKGSEKRGVDILIPTFALLVGRLEVTVETSSDMVLLRSNFAHKQQSADGHRLLHYSLDQFFTPTLTLAVKQSPSRLNLLTGFGQLGKLVLFLLWSLPAVLVLMLLINLGTEFKHMRQSLDRLEAENSFDHSKIPEPSTETIFVTTTIFSQSPSSSDLGTPTMYTTTTSLTPTVSITPTPSTHLPLSSSNSFPSSSSSVDRSESDTTTSTFTSIPTLSSSPRPSENSLLPISAVPFEWSKLRIELYPVARQSVDKVLEGLGIVWQVVRKVYHYPLDPP